MKPSTEKNGGFSVLELLVAVVIISIMAGVAVPVFRHNRESAQKTECLAKLRGLGHAILLYTQENAGQFPRSVHSANMYRMRNWAFVALPYLGEATEGLRSVPEGPFNRFFRCPAHDETRANTYSYALNVHFELDPDIDGNTYAGYPATWRRMQSLPMPSRTILLAETAERGDHLMCHFWSNSRDSQNSVAYQRHGDSNYLFADGHAETLPLKSVYDPAAGVNLWNPSLAR